MITFSKKHLILGLLLGTAFIIGAAVGLGAQAEEKRTTTIHQPETLAEARYYLEMQERYNALSPEVKRYYEDRAENLVNGVKSEQDAETLRGYSRAYSKITAAQSSEE